MLRWNPLQAISLCRIVACQTMTLTYEDAASIQSPCVMTNKCTPAQQLVECGTSTGCWRQVENTVEL